MEHQREKYIKESAILLANHGYVKLAYSQPVESEIKDIILRSIKFILVIILDIYSNFKTYFIYSIRSVINLKFNNSLSY